MLFVTEPRDHARTRIAPVMDISLKPSTMVVMVSSKVMILVASASTIPVTAIPKEPQYRAFWASQASRMAMMPVPERSGLVIPV